MHLKVIEQVPTPFQCDICDKYFTQQSGLNKHKSLVHNYTKQESTDDPNESVKFKSEDQNEDKNESEDDSTDGNKCYICKEIYDSESELASHFKAYHPNKRPIKCIHKKCTKTFYLTRFLKIHVNRFHQNAQLQSPTDFQCQQCNRYYKNISALNQHLKVQHDVQPESSMKIKYVPLKTENEMDIDNEFGYDDQIEDIKTPEDCFICNETFASNLEIVSHFKEAHPGKHPTICLECGKGFYFKHQLTLHSKEIHQMDPTNTCKNCGKLFSSYAALKNHYQSAHNVEMVADFVCKKCGKRFQNTNHLKKHLKVHMKTKIVCDTCGKLFASEHNLNYHVKTQHDGSIKKITCTKCNTKFGSFKELRLHQKNCETGNFKVHYLDFKSYKLL